MTTFRFFRGIHWLLIWMLLYVLLVILVVNKHQPDTYGFWNLGAMITAFTFTLLCMWIRSRL
jgi:hypothetical protein